MKHDPAVDRAGFLRAGASLAGAAALMGAGPSSPGVAADASKPLEIPATNKTLGAGVNDPPYGMPSKYERDVIRRTVPFLTAEDKSSVSFTPLQDLDGIITPSGLCFVRDHGGSPMLINPHEHRLVVHGLVDRPLEFTMNDIIRLPSESHVYFMECGANGGMDYKGAQMQGVQFSHGMVHCCEWTGVKLSVLMDQVGIKPTAKWMLAEGADAAAMTRSVPIDKALDDAMIAWSQNGERLRPENGYPLRLVLPGWQANLNVKWLRRLKFGPDPWETREETSKYTELLPDGKSRQFDWVMGTKSVITGPCPEKPLTAHGFREVSGLAWSGFGKITRVDVSFDGGVNWKPAALAEPVLTKALTRFRIPWEWNGESVLLQSRAVDDTGHVQPTQAQILAARGGNAIYNRNAIHTWRVNPNGTVDSVQVA
ncbi:MAG: sulfite dehydrogenase [Candidatus Velthaea sp.]